MKGWLLWDCYCWYKQPLFTFWVLLSGCVCVCEREREREFNYCVNVFYQLYFNHLSSRWYVCWFKLPACTAWYKALELGPLHLTGQTCSMRLYVQTPRYTWWVGALAFLQSLHRSYPTWWSSFLSLDVISFNVRGHMVSKDDRLETLIFHLFNISSADIFIQNVLGSVVENLTSHLQFILIFNTSIYFTQMLNTKPPKCSTFLARNRFL